MNLQRLRMAGISEKNSEADDKPNEDAFAFDQSAGFAIIADGVTRARNPDGSYPGDLGARSAQIFVHEAAGYLCDALVRFDWPGERIMREAFRVGNEAIKRENLRLGLTPEIVDYDLHDYLGTTACIVIVHEKTGQLQATVGVLGDTMVLHATAGGRVVLYSRNQLAEYHRYARPLFHAMIHAENVTPAEADRRKKIFKGTAVRNKKGAVSPVSGLPMGFGVLTGEDGALDFIDAQTVPVTRGDRLYVASDALRACAPDQQSDAEENASWYTPLLAEVRELALEVAAQQIIRRIREKERDSRVRSDDATVVAIESG